jgi:hypothetical protein
MRGYTNRIFWGTCVIVLTFGSLGPIFRSDDFAAYVGFVCSLVLGGALLWKVLRAQRLP